MVNGSKRSNHFFRTRTMREPISITDHPMKTFAYLFKGYPSWIESIRLSDAE
jgi:hypothetical protein